MDKFLRDVWIRTGYVATLLALFIIILNVLVIIPKFSENAKFLILDEVQVSASTLNRQFEPEPMRDCPQSAWIALDIKTTISQSVKLEYFLPVCETNQESDSRTSTLNLLKIPDFQKALAGTSSAVFLPKDGLETPTVVVIVPLSNNGAINGILRMTRPTLLLRETLKNQVIAIWCISFGFWLALAVSFHLLQLRWLKPLDFVTKHFSVHPMQAFEIHATIAKEIRPFLQVLQQSFKSDLAHGNMLPIADKSVSAVLREMSDGILIINQSGLVEFFNPSARLLFDIPEDFPTFHSLAETVRNHHVSDLFSACTENDETQTVLFEIPAKKKYIQTIGKKLTEDFGGNILILFQDVSRIHQLETIRRDFVSNVSHELRTPLASIKAVADTLQEGALNDPPAAKKFVASMQGEIDNLIQLVEELLELSRIESAKVPLVLQPVAPSQLIEKAVERMRLQAERAGITIISSLSGELPHVNADASRINQVTMNLIHNAIKFTQPGGKIEVTVKRQTDDMVFAIQDNGSGIHPRDLDRIFERFYKSDRSRSAHGTGLGLSIAKHIIEAHGGKIWVESVLTQGSTFYFSLPILKT